MALARRGGTRTHRMQRAAGLSDTGQMTMQNSIGPCCKMWFPMTETSGTTLTDVAGGAVVTPTSLSFVTPGTVRPILGAGFPLSAGVGLTPTSGALPTIGTKDFILFAVQRLSDATARANTYFGLKNAADDYIGVFDGDGATIRSCVTSLPHAETETFAGQNGSPFNTANAVIRNGSSLGNWVHPDTADAAAQGNTVGSGEVYARVLRNEGYIDSNPATYGRYSRNDFGIPDSIIASWQTPLGGGNPVLSYSDLTFGTSVAGLPGVWPYIDPTFDVGTITKITAASAVPAANDYYGLALFVFNSGLPSDFKQALRWMKAQWIAGNKVIWPGWTSIT